MNIDDLLTVTSYETEFDETDRAAPPVSRLPAGLADPLKCQGRT
jgi:hypothetical protein